MADSRPLPGPCTRTCTRRNPKFIASRPQFSAATVAAKGVDFFEPLNPALPADPHASALPRMSVIVISRLLNVAEIWAIPSVSTTFFDRLAVAALAGVGAVILLLRHFLLTGDGTPGTFLGPCVRVGPLPPYRKTPAMPDSPVAPDIHQPLDIHRHFGAKRAFHFDRALDDLAEPGNLRIRQIAHPGIRVDPGFPQNPRAGGTTDTKNVGQGDLDPFLPGKIDAGNTCHDQPCRCLCLGLRLQMTRTTPCRLMTLQCSQIGLTLERTFTCFSRPGLRLAGQYRSGRNVTQVEEANRINATRYPTTLTSTNLQPALVRR